MKIKQSKRILFYWFFTFLFVSILSLHLILKKENTQKRDVIKSDIISYGQIVDKYMDVNNITVDNIDSIENLVNLLPSHVRFGVVDEHGILVFHNTLSVVDSIRFIEKPEMKTAFIEGAGWSKRKSDLTNEDFIFYAKYDKEKDLFITIGIPYTEAIHDFLRPNEDFFIFLGCLFAISFLFFYAMLFNYNKLLIRLKQFIHSYWDGNQVTNLNSVPNDLKELATLINDVYSNLESKEKDISIEREKLLGHFQFSEEGISFFSETMELVYTNSYFVQYLNVILDKPTFDVTNLFQSPLFEEVVNFIENPGDEKKYKGKITSNGNYFSVRAIVFEDKSFEIIINDISEEEQMLYDKSEITNNIAHEIKTPITSIRGYLETILEHKNIAVETARNFVERAYNQSIRLSEIIQDVILLSKVSNAQQYFELEPVNIYDLLNQQVKQDCLEAIRESNTTIDLIMNPNVIINGNSTLLYSLFFNLGMNALKYAGDNTTITINNYMEDDEFYYFSFADNGVGVDDKHLARIFERFYRVTEGRTRDTGGSGLGLSIVKDAVNFHHGTIQAKNKAGGGLEYIFTLRKY